MKKLWHEIRRWSLAMIALGSMIGGAITLQSCAGEGGTLGGGGGGGGSINAQFVALLPPGQDGATFVGSEACEPCHNGQTTGEHYFDDWAETMHASQNVGCEKCHGPGSNHVASPALTNILSLPKSTSPIVCAQCHGPIFDEWKVSQHSKLVLSPVQSNTQNPAQARSSRCITCHSGLFRTAVYEKGKDPSTMTDQEIRTLGEWTMNDVPHTASCDTCHNPHKNTGNLSDNGKEVQLRHKVFNADTSQIAPGTTATQFTKFDHICAECHNGRGVDPSDAKLQTGTSRPSMHDSPQYNMLMGIGGVEGGGPPSNNTAHQGIAGQCSTCHMGNSRHTFTVSFDTGCVPCHTASDAAVRTATVKAEIQNSLYSLLARMQSWSQTTFGDPDLWDYTSIIQANGGTPPNQSLVPIEIKRARHNYYFVIRDACFGPHNAPYGRFLIRVANDNLDLLGVPKSAAKNQVSAAQKEDILLRQIEVWKRAMKGEHDD